jgi:hypothetical protein
VNIEASDTTARSISPDAAGSGGGEVCNSSVPEGSAAGQPRVKVPRRSPRESDREYWIANSLIALILIALLAMLVIAVG